MPRARDASLENGTPRAANTRVSKMTGLKKRNLQFEIESPANKSPNPLAQRLRTGADPCMPRHANLNPAVY